MQQKQLKTAAIKQLDKCIVCNISFQMPYRKMMSLGTGIQIQIQAVETRKIKINPKII